MDDILHGAGVGGADAGQVVRERAGAVEGSGQVQPGAKANLRRCAAVAVLAGLEDSAAERRVRVARKAGKQCVDGEGTCGLAKDGDLLWVASECSNVALDPVKSSSLVQEAKVAASGVEFGRGREAKDWQR